MDGQRFDGVFWALVEGDPTIGSGIDNGDWDVSDWSKARCNSDNIISQTACPGPTFMIAFDKFCFVLLSVTWLTASVCNAQGKEPCDFGKPGASLAKWYPDSQALIFYQSGEQQGIYKVLADGTGKEALVSSGDLGHPSVAADGQTILFQRKLASTKKIVLVLRSPDGNESVITDTANNSTDGSLDPKGEWIAFTGEDDKKNLDIYVIKTDGKEQKRLTFHDDYDYSPHWSPDGSKILFTSHRDGHPNIHIMDIDGSNKKNLTPGPKEEFSAAWNPGGQEIVFSSRNPEAEKGLDPLTKHNTSELFVMSLINGATKQITTNSDLDVLPHWSPDGKKIAFTTCATGNREVFIINADGSDGYYLTKTDY